MHICISFDVVFGKSSNVFHSISQLCSQRDIRYGENQCCHGHELNILCYFLSLCVICVRTCVCGFFSWKWLRKIYINLHLAFPYMNIVVLGFTNSVRYMKISNTCEEIFIENLVRMHMLHSRYIPSNRCWCYCEFLFTLFLYTFQNIHAVSHYFPYVFVIFVVSFCFYFYFNQKLCWIFHHDVLHTIPVRSVHFTPFNSYMSFV